MDKLKMHSVNKVDENIEKIGKLFPNCVTETIVDDKLTKVIDFDVLRQELSDVEVDGPQERYQFTWPDKRKSVLLANAPIAKTLRPCREKSVDFDKTENIYIEGDNLDALKLLQETYLGKVKMIYIDPPYNTGNDFVYDDDFRQDSDDYMPGSGQYDENGGQLVTNLESNGRFHTDWLNMIYPRLKLAKDLLTDDGAIFISIDENEVHNLRKICNEVFGINNFVGTFIWRKKDGGGQAKQYFIIEHEYILVYKKSELFKWKDKEEMRDISEYNKKDQNGNFKISKLAKWGNTARREDRPSMYFSLIAPDGTEVYPIAPDGNDGRWRVGKQRMNEIVEDDLLYWGKKDGKWIAYEKEYYNKQSKTIKQRSILYNLANTGDGTNVLTELFQRKDLFENPKPLELFYIFIEAITHKNDIVLDFFSGSATTAHAVMQLNAEDGGHRKFIMVQLPEETDEKSEARKAGYNNICEIGEERIRRAGKKIKEDNKDKEGIENLDTGFRVFKVNSTNMKKVYYKPADYKQEQMALFADNIKPDRTPEDLLFQVMLDLGILLSSKIEEKTIGGRKVFSVADGYLIACFDNNITAETVTEIAKQRPYYAVFRDSGMADDSVATNFEQIFKTYSPTTVRKVL